MEPQDTDLEALRAEAADPRTPADRLFELSTTGPALLPDLATNPALYPGLREWLAALGDPAVDEALVLGAARADAAGTPWATLPTRPADDAAEDTEPVDPPANRAAARPGAPVRTSLGARRPTTSYTAPARGRSRGYRTPEDTDRLPPVIIPATPPERAAQASRGSATVASGALPRSGPGARARTGTGTGRRTGATGAAAPAHRRPLLPLALLLIAVAAAAYLLGTRVAGGDTEAAPSPSPTHTLAPLGDVPPGATPAGSTPDTVAADRPRTGAAAEELLRRRRADSLEVLSFDGRWMLQLASKSDGQRDPFQTTAGGSHTFDLVDIWGEHEDLTLALAAQDVPAYLLDAEDFGPQRDRDATFWVTLADPGDLATRADAERACTQLFPDLTGDELENACLPRRLDPPSAG